MPLKPQSAQVLMKIEGGDASAEGIALFAPINHSHVALIADEQGHYYKLLTVSEYLKISALYAGALCNSSQRVCFFFQHFHSDQFIRFKLHNRLTRLIASSTRQPSSTGGGLQVVSVGLSQSTPAFP